MKMSCPANSNNPNASKCPVKNFLCGYGELINLFARVFMANIFWKSGMIMYAYYINNDFDRQVEIFRGGLGLPVPEAFAWFTMIAEILLAILLCIGLFGRLAALVLIIVTGIVEFGQISNIDHIYWFIILSFILIRGSGKISLDKLLCGGMNKHCGVVAAPAPVVKAAPKKKKPAKKK